MDFVGFGEEWDGNDNRREYERTDMRGEMLNISLYIHHVALVL